MDHDSPQMRDDLNRLHAELEHTRTVDPESRQLLVHLQSDIQAVLKESTPAARASLRARLQAAVDALEDSHPGLTLLLKQVLDHIAEA